MISLKIYRTRWIIFIYYLIIKRDKHNIWRCSFLSQHGIDHHFLLSHECMLEEFILLSHEHTITTHTSWEDLVTCELFHSFACRGFGSGERNAVHQHFQLVTKPLSSNQCDYSIVLGGSTLMLPFVHSSGQTLLHLQCYFVDWVFGAPFICWFVSEMWWGFGAYDGENHCWTFLFITCFLWHDALVANSLRKNNASSYDPLHNLERCCFLDFYHHYTLRAILPSFDGSKICSNLYLHLQSLEHKKMVRSRDE